MHKFSIVHRLDEHSTHLAHQLEEALIQFGYEKDEEHPDGVIVIGGDGTFIYAVHKYLYCLNDIVLIGMHTGTLGFYMDYRDDEIGDFLMDLIPGHLPVENYPLLEVTYDDSKYYALNEIRIENPIRTQNINVLLDDVNFELFRGTGLCLLCS